VALPLSPAGDVRPATACIIQDKAGSKEQALTAAQAVGVYLGRWEESREPAALPLSPAGGASPQPGRASGALTVRAGYIYVGVGARISVVDGKFVPKYGSGSPLLNEMMRGVVCIAVLVTMAQALKQLPTHDKLLKFGDPEDYPTKYFKGTSRLGSTPILTPSFYH
jgi:hypothetical protein